MTRTRPALSVLFLAAALACSTLLAGCCEGSTCIKEPPCKPKCAKPCEAPCSPASMPAPAPAPAPTPK